MQTSDLFYSQKTLPWCEQIAPQSFHLHGFACDQSSVLVSEIESLIAESPLRHMQTPGGREMSVAMTNCGRYGWITDRKGYRYSAVDPLRRSVANSQINAAWPAMPDRFLTLSQTAAAEAGFANFSPDACLINYYSTSAKMALHQDRDEADFSAPIVSVSLGQSAQFLFGGLTRRAETKKITLQHGDVIVWGGEDRLRFHGIKSIAAGSHPLIGEGRYNLTFRKAK
jgi:alkylated DNA repair protein (DNA oxidative demethylase)